jgi:hypothetical protein
MRKSNHRSRGRVALAGALAFSFSLLCHSPAPAWQYDEEKDVPESVRAKGDAAVTEWVEQQTELSLREKRRVAVERAKERDEVRSRAKEGFRRKAERLAKEETERKAQAVAAMKKANESRFYTIAATIALMGGAGFWWSRSRAIPPAIASARRQLVPAQASAPISAPAEAMEATTRVPLSTAAFPSMPESPSAATIAPRKKAQPVPGDDAPIFTPKESRGFRAFLPAPGESMGTFNRVATGVKLDPATGAESTTNAEGFEEFLPEEPLG